MGIGGNPNITDITQEKGTKFPLKEVGKAIVQQNKAIIANLASINNTMQIQAEINGRLYKEFQMFHKFQQKNFQEIKLSLKGISMSQDRKFLLEVIKYADQTNKSPREIMEEVNNLLKEVKTSK